MRLAYLGPVGTYGEQAAKRLAALEGMDAELVPQQGIRSVIQALAMGHGLHHRADPLLGHQLGLDPLQPGQLQGRLLPVGADGTEEGKAHGGG